MNNTPPNTSPKKSTEKQKTLEELTEEELLEKAIEYRDLSKRLAADYQNLQRDTEKRIQDIRKYATADLIVEMASLIDYFNSAFAGVPEEEKNSSWMQGIKYIQDHLIKTLQDHGVEIIETTGQQLNPHEHESVGEEESDQPENTVIKQMQVGLKLNDKVIRPAKVIVAKGSFAEEADQ